MGAHNPGKNPREIIEEMEKIDDMEYNPVTPCPLNQKVKWSQQQPQPVLKVVSYNYFPFEKVVLSINLLLVFFIPIPHINYYLLVILNSLWKYFLNQNV